MLNKYIKFLQRSPKHVQDNHILALAGVSTLVISILWLHFYYGLFDFGFYQDITISEADIKSQKGLDASSTPVNIVDTISSPIDEVIGIFKETGSKIQDFSILDFK